jgi:hypothetical protein
MVRAERAGMCLSEMSAGLTAPERGITPQDEL